MKNRNLSAVAGVAAPPVPEVAVLGPQVFLAVSDIRSIVALKAAVPCINVACGVGSVALAVVRPGHQEGVESQTQQSPPRRQ